MDWNTVYSNLYHLALTYILAFPIGWERERRTRSAGLRTFPLVAVASCGYMLIGIRVFTGMEAQARVAFGIITGMGFIGGGAIIRGSRSVHGTATAASLWNTGAIGLAVAWNSYETAIIIMLLNYITLRYATFMKSSRRVDNDEQGELHEPENGT